MPCKAAPDEHCCWVDGEVCPFFDATTKGPFWKRCTLRTELGDWELVHRDPRYTRAVKPVWKSQGIADCGDWAPTVAAPCGSCGWDGT